MSGGPQFATPGTKGSGDTLAVNERPELVFVNNPMSDTVAAGAQEVIEIYPPEGSVYEILEMELYATNISAATSGKHVMEVVSADSIKSIYGRSTFDQGVRFKYSHWQYANDEKLPPSDAGAGSAMRNQFAIPEMPLVFSYANNSDGDKTATRTYDILFTEVSY